MKLTYSEDTIERRLAFDQSVIPMAVWMVDRVDPAWQNPAFEKFLSTYDLSTNGLIQKFPQVESAFNKCLNVGEPIFSQPVQFKNAQAFKFHFQPFSTEPHARGKVLVTVIPSEAPANQEADQSFDSLEPVYSLILQAPIAIGILKGPEFHVEVVNAALLQQWGKEESEVINRPAMEISPELKSQGYDQLLKQVYSSGEPYSANESMVQIYRKGELVTLYMNFVYQPIRNIAGEVDRIITIGTEVTEQVLSRKKIAIAEERARLANESAFLGTYVLDLKTNEITTSGRFNEIWGQEASVDRETYASSIHPDDTALRAEAHKRAQETGILNYEARIFRPTGEMRWIKANGKILYDENNEPERLIGVIQDITEQKQFTEELSRQVNERTTELRKANERLASINEELEQFAYVASHDLQEPLRKITLFSKMVMEQPQIPTDTKKYLEKINNASNRMTGLIHNLLDYSRLSQKEALFQTVDLHDVVKNVLSDFEVTVGQKSAHINVHSLPVLQAIPFQMNQLMHNLIGNALKFSRRGITPTIDIKSEELKPEDLKNLEHITPGQKYYKISISDNGIGFNQDYAEKIFTIFQRLNENALYGGYGIGLALCKKIVTNHKGYIFAEGEPGKGASFNIIIPEQPLKTK